MNGVLEKILNFSYIKNIVLGEEEKKSIFINQL